MKNKSAYLTCPECGNVFDGETWFSNNEEWVKAWKKAIKKDFGKKVSKKCVSGETHPFFTKWGIHK